MLAEKIAMHGAWLQSSFCRQLACLLDLVTSPAACLSCAARVQLGAALVLLRAAL
jgi:hypothetical protein